MYFHVFRTDLQNLFSAFLPFFPEKSPPFFRPAEICLFLNFSIFFSKCKQFSFICVNRMFNNKMNYSEHKIIKNNFFENNVHMKINKVNANIKIKMCLHHALCF